MIRYSLAVLAALFWVTSEAAAIDCAAEAPSGKGHWSWRMIDGKKCWYPGRPGISKDKLRWPGTVGQSSGQDTDGAPAARPAPTVAPAAPVARRNPVQTTAADDAEAESALTFRDRWRLR